LLYLFSFLWNVILVLIFNMVIVYMRRLAIEMHSTRTHKFFIDQHPGNNCVLFIELFTNRHLSAIKKNDQSVFLFQLLQFDYEDLRNNYLFYNLLPFLTFALFITYILYKVHLYLEVEPLAETYCFLLKTMQIWVITFVVVLDQYTVTFQKGWGRGLLQFVWY
jgi:hypothetical protein